MPEIKTRQRKNQPVMNTAQRQMQRNFVRSKAEQAAHRQSEQPDSPSNDAEEKISRTAEDAVRDGASLAVREIRSLHQRNDDKHGISSEADMPEEYQKAPAKGPSRSRPATQQETGRKAAVQRIVQQQQANATGGVPESSDALSHRTAQKPIRTREQSIAVPAQTAQQEAARKAAVQNIVRQRQTQKQEKVFYTPEDGDAIVDVALSQVGNVGGEPYWSWYGFSNHVEWCACFVSWCADQCGYLDSGTYPKFSGCVFGMQWFQQRGLWLDSSTEPVPGMLIFFDWATQDGVPDHVGIVEKVENGMVYTVEGNSRDMCRQKQYSLGSGVILGYGMAASGT